jgi:formiminoglutamase
MTDPDDPRVGDLLGRALTHPSEAVCVVVGFPVDEGVRRNGGRVGAAQGPAAIRRCLYRFTPDPQRFEPFVRLLERTADLGDVPPTGDLEADQAALGELLTPYLRRGATAVVLGGGHETAFGHFLGHVGAGERVEMATDSGQALGHFWTGRRVGVLNWDAHPDVRPLRDGGGHSGSPFRQILEHPSGACASYTVAGLNPQGTARAHMEFLAAHGGRGVFRSELTPESIRNFYPAAGDLMVSFDLDALDQSVAPGVSAPNACGLPPELWLLAAEQAGSCPAVRSMDVVELNPLFDRDDQTARLAALTVWHFWRGLTGRG